MKKAVQRRWVLVGGGYAGLAFASRWSHRLPELKETLKEVPKLTLLSNQSQADRTCELYKVLRDGSPRVFNLPQILKNKSVDFKEARVFKIDAESKKLHVRTDILETCSYDRLILSTGFSRIQPKLNSSFEIADFDTPHAPRVFFTKSNKQYGELRTALKRICWSEHSKSMREQFVVVVGGGATGVEIASEIAHLKQCPSRRVLVIDAMYDPLKATLGAVANKMLKKRLRQMGVEFFEGSGVDRVELKTLTLGNGQKIPWDLLVFAQGAYPDKELLNPFSSSLNSLGQIRVQHDFQIPDWPDHYAMGDLAFCDWSDGGFPRTAQVAAQQGFYLADLMANDLLGALASQRPSFQFKDWGYLVSMGPRNGIGRLGPYHLPIIWGPAVETAKEGAAKKYALQITTGLKI